MHFRMMAEYFGVDKKAFMYKNFKKEHNEEEMQNFESRGCFEKITLHSFFLHIPTYKKKATQKQNRMHFSSTHRNATATYKLTMRLYA